MKLDSQPRRQRALPCTCRWWRQASRPRPNPLAPPLGCPSAAPHTHTHKTGNTHTHTLSHGLLLRRPRMRATTFPSDPCPTRDVRRMAARRGGAARIPTRGRWQPVSRTFGVAWRSSTAGRPPDGCYLSERVATVDQELRCRCAAPSAGAWMPTPSSAPLTPPTLLALRCYKYRLTTGEWVGGSTARWGAGRPPPSSP